NRIAYHQRHEPMLDRVDTGRAHTTTRTDACDHHRVDAHRLQGRRERCAEERAGVLLHDHQLPRERSDLGHDPPEVATARERAQCGHLLHGHTAVGTRGAELETRVNHGYAGAARRLDDPSGRVETITRR